MDEKFNELDLNLLNNYRINIAFNLTFFTVFDIYTKFMCQLPVNYWVDGKVGAIFLKLIGIKSNYIRGPDLLRFIISYSIANDVQLYIIGNLDRRCEKFLILNKVKYKFIQTFNIHIGNKYDFKFDDRSAIYLITLPSPKQEYIASYSNGATVFCIGGALNIISKVESECPSTISKCGLEWAWRIFQNDTKRRLFRLFTSIYKFFKNYNKVRHIFK